MTVRDQTRIDRVLGAFQRGMSTDEVARTFGISAVDVARILRENDVRPGRVRQPGRAGGSTNVRASD